MSEVKSSRPFRLERLIDGRVIKRTQHATWADADAAGRRHLVDDYRMVKRAGFRIVEV